MNSDLMNVLGVLIAFITVMLVFSIAITSLVQATQGLFRFRARNLQKSLANILDSEKISDDPKKAAISILNRSDGALISGLFKIPDSWPSRFFGPQVSWMHPDDLDRELRKNELSLDDTKMVAVSEKFRRTQGSMSKVFLRRMRITTLVWAFVVAFYYQLSTPQLFHDFSTDPALQAQAEATGRHLLAGSVETPAETGNEPYFQLDPWSAGMAFYYLPVDADGEPLDCSGDNGNRKECGFHFSFIQGANLVGVFITVMLLSLGAPFWFDMLKKVVNLKDTLAKETDSVADEGAAEPDTTAGLNDERIALLQERMLASTNPLLKASLQKEINDLRLVRVAKMTPP